MKTRHVIQGLFLGLVLVGVYVFGKNLEVWCPFGGIECLSLYIHDGKMLCALGSSNFFILVAILLLTLALRRVFCGYMCPLGAIAEAMRMLSRKLGIKQIKPSAKIDQILSMTKYVILGLVLWGTFAATELIFRHADPCFAMIGYSTNEEVLWTTFVTLGVFVVSALFVSMPFCRWFCPFAAVLNLFSKCGFTRIQRHTESCVDCGKCTKACPMQIDVAKCTTVTQARCLSCGDCIQACPVTKTPTLAWHTLNGRPIRHINRVVIAAIVLCIALAVTAHQIIPFDTFIHMRDVDKPALVDQYKLNINGVSCSGSARQLIFFLDRDDMYAVPGYLKIATSPAEGFVAVQLTYDPTQTDPNALMQALSEPYYDATESRWRPSPFEIEGYDPFAGF